MRTSCTATRSAPARRTAGPLRPTQPTDAARFTNSSSVDPSAQLRTLRRRLDSDLFGIDIVPDGKSTPVEATFRSRAVKEVPIARYSGTPVTVYRTRSQIRRTPRDDYLVTMQLRGVARLVQRRRHIELQPGDLTVIDGGEPYALRLAGTGSYELLTIRVPRTRLIRSPATDVSAIRLAADSGPGRVLVPYFHTLSDVSVRHLYRLFAEQGISFGHWLHEQRLRECHRDLSDPDMADVPVAGIGLRWGYSPGGKASTQLRVSSDRLAARSNAAGPRAAS